MDRSPWWSRGAILAGLAVALGAFGAHGLKKIVEPELLETWHTAAHYQLAHALALLLCAAFPGRALKWPPRLFAAGILLFSGSLYALVLSGVGALGAVTPLGGLCFLLGWGIFAWQARPGRPPW